MGVRGAVTQPWKKVAAAPALAISVPPLKLKVAVGLPPVCELALRFVTEVTESVPPSRLTVPALLTVLPAALREMSSRPQLTAPVLVTVKIPLPRLATYRGLDGLAAVPIFITPPLTVTRESSPRLEPLAP